MKKKYIFVHGLSGWGSYDKAYKRMPYWGMRGGDLIRFLREQGYDCYAASVAPTGSAWDRACELYAQLAGLRVDYGEEHSRRNIDHAAELNRRISTLPYAYFFSVPCSITKYQEDGTCLPDKETEPMFVMRSCQIGAYKGKTAGGTLIDESWRENDGLVNTVSAMAPMRAPSKTLDRAHIVPGVWNVFPVIHGDHMWLQGGLLRKHDIRRFYMDLLGMIDKLGDAIEKNG